jgi:hypothetical protein
MNQKLLIDRVESLSEGFSLSKYNFLKISYLLKLIEESDHFSTQCKTCAENKKILANMVEEIPFLDDIEHRQPYEKQFNQIRRHFHREHGFIPPYRFSATYSLIGILAGTLSATLVSFVFGGFNIDVFLAGAVIGLIAGYFLGSAKELKYRKSKKMI